MGEEPDSKSGSNRRDAQKPGKSALVHDALAAGQSGSRPSPDSFFCLWRLRGGTQSVPTPTTTTHPVTVTAFLDENGNGIFDPTEGTRIPNVEVVIGSARGAARGGLRGRRPCRPRKARKASP